MWFSTSEEDERQSRALKHELNALKEELAPVIDAIERQESHKSN